MPIIDAQIEYQRAKKGKNMTTKIHRIAIAVKDIDVAIEKYSKMFGATFVKTADAVSQHVGVYVASDWSIGIELASPVPGSLNPVAQKMEKFLAHNGEGVFGTAFAVDDMAMAVATANKAGTQELMPTFGFTPEQLDAEFGGVFTRFEETLMDTEDECGFTVAFCLFEPNAMFAASQD
jgi:catechol 2,3-dioxygenase-like lactoylglutathione lyase family enzyme